MSEGPELSEDEAFAAEHALGVLSARERADAETRMARDPAFAAEVEAWRDRLAPLVETVESVAPPVPTWARIERMLPANDNNVAVARRLRFWRSATVGSLSLAAATLVLAVMLANRPPTVLQQQISTQPLLNASLEGQGGVQPLFVAAYDPDRKALIITSLLPPGGDPLHVHQLWLIPADGKPRSLGFVEPGKSKAVALPQGINGLVAAGAALAVSIEQPGGSPNKDGPTGPIAAMGKLAKI
jgi:anti-sigma-K factor RskA